jgi:hypothetical protein
MSNIFAYQEDFMGREEIKSMFELYSKNETGLSRTLAALIYSDCRILKQILLKFKYEFPAAEAKTLNVFYEFTSNNSRFDVLCESANYAIIIETKIDINTVSDAQIEKYLDELAAREKPRQPLSRKRDQKAKNLLLILITQFDNQPGYSAKVKAAAKKTGVEIISIGWGEVYKIIQDLKVTVDLSEEFDNYLVRSFDMKISEIDVWAVSITQKSEIKRFDEKKAYFHGIKHRPIFIGRREWNKELKRVVVDALYPVKEIHAHDSPQGKKYLEPGHDPGYVYVLGDPIKLKEPAKKRFTKNQVAAVNVSFDEI